MRALIQRVGNADVKIESKTISEIKKGLLVLISVSATDDEKDAKYLAEKCVNLRIFEDAQNKMNLSVKDVDGSILVVSQFTLYADTRRGNRPSFTNAAPPEHANQMYKIFVENLKLLMGSEHIKTGVFGAMMNISLVNEGPVTILLESKETL